MVDETSPNAGAKPRENLYGVDILHRVPFGEPDAGAYYWYPMDACPTKENAEYFADKYRTMGRKVRVIRLPEAST